MNPFVSLQAAQHIHWRVPDFPRIEKGVEIISRRKPGILLDIGYCEDSFADRLVDKDWKCVGLDVNCRRTPKVTTLCADVNSGLPFRSESFDAITAGEVIEHTMSEAHFLQECHRVLKKDGDLLLTTPNLGYTLNRFLVALGKVPMFVYAPYHYHFHTLKTLTNLVKQHHFRILKTLSSHVLFSRRFHRTGKIFELLGDLLPTFGAHLILHAQKC